MLFSAHYFEYIKISLFLDEFGSFLALYLLFLHFQRA